jgi:hypothetical protein
MVHISIPRRDLFKKPKKYIDIYGGPVLDVPHHITAFHQELLL